MRVGEGWQAVLAVVLLSPSTSSFAAAVNGVRISSGPEATRVVLEISAPVEHRVFALSSPDRIVIDLPRSSAPAPLSLPEPKGLVAGIRSG